MFLKKSIALALTILAPVAASAAFVMPESTFRLSNGTGGPSLMYDSLTYKSGGLAMTFEAFNGLGEKVSVTQQSIGIGAQKQGDYLDHAGLGYSYAAKTGDYLTIKFNQAVRINSLTMSSWDWNLQGNYDSAALHYDGGAEFMTTNFAGYGTINQELVWFNMPSDVVGDTFILRNFPSAIDRTGFFLAGINVTAVVPEPASYALMGLGLAGIVLVKRRRSA